MRLIMKIPSQQEDWHPNGKSQIQQEDLPQKEDSSRKYLLNRESDSQTTNERPTGRSIPEMRFVNSKTHQKPKRKTGTREEDSCICIPSMCK